eukprot:1322579-Amorphochlora_amoeboformis.AAC.1
MREVGSHERGRWVGSLVSVMRGRGRTLSGRQELVCLCEGCHIVTTLSAGDREDAANVDARQD